MTNLKKTPLYQTHLELGAKISEFGGWEMPTQYSGIMEEHKAVRNKAGLFDVSHMGEIIVKGSGALKLLQKITTNDLSSIGNKQIQYTMMCYPDGGVVDDFLVYQFNQEKYLLVVNAANIQKDYKWITEHKDNEEVEVMNKSSQMGEVAFQGPLAEEILQQVINYDLVKINFFNFKDKVEISGVEALVSRTGYTGEDGFEIYTSQDDIKKVWDVILETGKNAGVKPVGLGARDTLRFEACLPLYGHEIGRERNPLEANLSTFVALDKRDFIGQMALKELKDSGFNQKLVGLEMIDRGIPRQDYKIFKKGKEVGVITSGSYSPTLDKNLGLGYVNTSFSELDTKLEVQIRRRKCKAKIVETPFYK